MSSMLWTSVAPSMWTQTEMMTMLALCLVTSQVGASMWLCGSRSPKHTGKRSHQRPLESQVSPSKWLTPPQAVGKTYAMPSGTLVTPLARWAICTHFLKTEITLKIQIIWFFCLGIFVNLKALLVFMECHNTCVKDKAKCCLQPCFIRPAWIWKK